MIRGVTLAIVALQNDERTTKKLQPIPKLMLRLLVIFVLMLHNGTLNAAAGSCWQRAKPTATATIKRTLKCNDITAIKKLLNKKTAPVILIAAAEYHYDKLVHAILKRFSKNITTETLEKALQCAQKIRCQSATITLLELHLDNRRQCTTFSILGF